MQNLAEFLLRKIDSKNLAFSRKGRHISLFIGLMFSIKLFLPIAFKQEK